MNSALEIPAINPIAILDCYSESDDEDILDDGALIEVPADDPMYVPDEEEPDDYPRVKRRKHRAPKVPKIIEYNNYVSAYDGVRQTNRLKFHVHWNKIFFGEYSSEQEAACAYDKVQLWMCHKISLDVSLVQLNFNSTIDMTQLFNLESITDLSNKMIANAKAKAFKGITKVNGIYTAKIHLGMRTWNLGSYKTDIDAAKAYDKALLYVKHKGLRSGNLQMNFPESNYTAEMEQMFQLNCLNDVRMMIQQNK